MKGLLRSVGEWSWGKFIIYAELSLFILFMVFYPSSIAGAVQVETVTAQITPDRVSTLALTSTPTPEPHGQVGENAGLVCGAGILVIIIIAGLMWSARWMQIRGHDVEREGEIE